MLLVKRFWTRIKSSGISIPNEKLLAFAHLYHQQNILLLKKKTNKISSFTKLWTKYCIWWQNIKYIYPGEQWAHTNAPNIRVTTTSRYWKMQWRSCKNKLEKILKNQNDFCKVELDYFPVYDPDELSNLDANLSNPGNSTKRKPDYWGITNLIFLFSRLILFTASWGQKVE